MRCEAYKALLSPYLDDQLTKEEQETLEAHLQNCIYCTEELEMLEEMVEQLHTLKEIEVPDHFHRELMKKVGEEKKESKTETCKTQKRNYKKVVAYLSSVAALFILGMIWVYNDKLPSQTDSVSPLTNVKGSAVMPKIAPEPNAVNEPKVSNTPLQTRMAIPVQEEWSITTTDVHKVEQVIMELLDKDQITTVVEDNRVSIVLKDVNNKKTIIQAIEALENSIITFDKQEMDTNSVHIFITQKQ